MQGNKLYDKNIYIKRNIKMKKTNLKNGKAKYLLLEQFESNQLKWALRRDAQKEQNQPVKSINETVCDHSF